MTSPIRNNFIALVAGLVLFMIVACQQPGVDSTGSEYMPDMAHSTAYETNVFSYYYLNTWDSASVVKLKEMSIPRLPVEGTVPRGYTGMALASLGAAADSNRMHVGAGQSGITVPMNGSVPYYYEDTEEERLRATADIIDNPFPITEAGLAQGQNLYTIFCGVCHGEKGDGAGYLVRDDGGVYPAAPANFLLDEFVAASNGRYYHSIMYGKNVMGSYADKLSYEERWQVTHYIRSLQAKEKKLEYSEAANTFNPVFGVPGASLAPLALGEATGEEAAMETEAAPAQETEEEQH